MSPESDSAVAPLRLTGRFGKNNRFSGDEAKETKVTLLQEVDQSNKEAARDLADGEITPRHVSAWTEGSADHVASHQTQRPRGFYLKSDTNQASGLLPNTSVLNLQRLHSVAVGDLEE